MIVLILVSNILLFVYFAYELIKLKKELIDLYSARIRRLELEVFKHEYTKSN